MSAHDALVVSHHAVQWSGVLCSRRASHLGGGRQCRQAAMSTLLTGGGVCNPSLKGHALDVLGHERPPVDAGVLGDPAQTESAQAEATMWPRSAPHGELGSRPLFQGRSQVEQGWCRPWNDALLKQPPWGALMALRRRQLLVPSSRFRWQAPPSPRHTTGELGSVPGASLCS